jgi:hypothetical protein
MSVTRDDRFVYIQGEVQAIVGLLDTVLVHGL